MKILRNPFSRSDLLAAGYKVMVDDLADNMHGDYIETFRKDFSDKFGIRYVLTFERYAYLANSVDIDLMEPVAQFKTGQNSFNVTLTGTTHTLADVEAFFRQSWLKLGCDHVDLF